MFGLKRVLPSLTKQFYGYSAVGALPKIRDLDKKRDILEALGHTQKEIDIIIEKIRENENKEKKRHDQINNVIHISDVASETIDFVVENNSRNKQIEEQKRHEQFKNVSKKRDFDHNKNHLYDDDDD